MKSTLTTLETWRDIDGYEGYYQVSDLGKVRSLDREIPSNGGLQTISGKVLTGRLNENGYAVVHFRREGTERNFFIHRLVASAFIGNPENLPDVNHKDGDKLNNRLSNLHWATRKFNMQHAVKHGLLKPDLSDSVAARRKSVTNERTGEIYESARVAAEKSGIHYSTLRAKLNGAKVNDTNLKYSES